jgi:serine/threonine-protein kinase RsbT
MNSAYDQLLGLLQRHISHINAQSIVGRALRDAGIDKRTLSSAHLPQLVSRLEPGLRLFVRPAALPAVREELKKLCGTAKAPEPVTRPIKQEPDISDVRSLARSLCDQLGARRISSQKVATVVSELARNIYMYAGEGTVQLHPEATPRPKIQIRAIDSGPGISNLEDVLSGNYRSRTGLGAGIRGTKRLADRFDIKTGPNGTRIDVEILL